MGGERSEREGWRSEREGEGEVREREKLERAGGTEK